MPEIRWIKKKSWKWDKGKGIAGSIESEVEKVGKKSKKCKRKKTASGQKQSFSRKDKLKFDKLMKKYLKNHGPLKFV